MWGHFHPIPYQSKIKEKFLSVFGIGLSSGQLLWWGSGIYLSVKMSHLVSPIGNDWLYSRLHYAIPFGISMYLCYFRQTSTNLPVWKYYLMIIRLRTKKRLFLYCKGGS